MATIAQLRGRITSVQNIGKITKAMKMVAAAKLRAVESRLAGVREFQKEIAAAWPERSEKDVAAQEMLPGVEPLEEPKKHLVVPYTTDRGLCGGVNSGILKVVRRNVSEHRSKGQEVSIVTIGEKGRSGLERLNKAEFRATITESGKQRPATFAEISMLAEEILSQDFDTATVLYNKFVSAIAYDVTEVRVNSLERAKFDREIWKNWELEGFQNEDEVFEALHEFRLAVRLQHWAIENATSEMSARMTAMENSTNNAGDMLGKLQLAYNRQRQTKITTELGEIVSGAAAVSDA